MRAVREPDRPTTLKPPSAFDQAELGQAQAVAQAAARNKAAQERFEAELQDYFARNGFIEVTFR